jgi:uncharacterized protein
VKEGSDLTADKIPLIQVMGEGQVEMVPDTAEVSLGVSIRADEAGAAYSQTAVALNQVVRALLEFGIPQDQIQTEQIGLDPIYERDQLSGYQGSATLRVTLTDLSAVGATIDRAVAAGANVVRGVTFTVRDTKRPDESARTLAVRDAQRQAVLLSRDLGVRLGPVWRVDAEPSLSPGFPTFARAAALEALPVLPGTLTLTRRVQIECVIQNH